MLVVPVQRRGTAAAAFTEKGGTDSASADDVASASAERSAGESGTGSDSGSVPSGLLNGLVAFWELEESSGARVDATGRGNDLTPVNTPGNTTGKVGNALALVRSSSQRVYKDDSADVDLSGGSFTILFWLRLTSLPDFMTIVSKGLGTTGDTDYTIEVSDTGIVNFQVYDEPSGANGATVFWPTNLPTSTWVFIVCQFDAVNPMIGIAINGTTFEEASFPFSTIRHTSAPFALGARQGASNLSPLNGQIDQAGIWKRLLTTSEINYIRNGGAGRTYAEIAAAP